MTSSAKALILSFSFLAGHPLYPQSKSRLVKCAQPCERSEVPLGIHPKSLQLYGLPALNRNHLRRHWPKVPTRCSRKANVLPEGSKSRALIVTLAFGLLGFFANLPQINVSADTPLLFGGVFYLAITLLYGPLHRATAALLIPLPTALLWRHPETAASM